MNYKKLSLDQRINLASQYALLLVADTRSTEEIIGILKNDYKLTEEQAAQAFAVMHTDYKAAYNSTVLRYKALGIMGFSLLVFLACYFMGNEMVSGGAFPMIFAIIFGMVALGALILTGRILWERFSQPDAPKGARLGKPFRKYNHIDKLLFHFTSVCFVVFLLYAYLYFSHADIVAGKDIVTIHQCIIKEPVRLENTGGKHNHYYYAFKFRGHNLKCRFFKEYYRYSQGVLLISDVEVGDTVSIQIFKEKLDYFNDQHSTGDLEIINLGFPKGFMIDHNYRNARVQKSHETNFYICLAAFTGILMIIGSRELYYSIKLRQQIGNDR